jgi:hypothetical protein
VEQELEVEEGRLTSLGNTSLMLQVSVTMPTMQVELKKTMFFLFVSMVENAKFCDNFFKTLVKNLEKRNVPAIFFLEIVNNFAELVLLCEFFTDIWLFCMSSIFGLRKNSETVFRLNYFSSRDKIKFRKYAKTKTFGSAVISSVRYFWQRTELVWNLIKFCTSGEVG